MKAIELQESFGLDNLKLAERPEPKPGAGEVVVQMKAATLNYRDLLFVQGTMPFGAQLPIIPISDGCGVVVETGLGVERVTVGDRVCPLFFQNWFSGPKVEQGGLISLGGPADGVVTEYMCLSAQGVSRVPDFLSDAEAAALPCAALTAWDALFVQAQAKPGDVVVLQGTGGVSIFGLQFAKAAGCTVVITSSSDEKLKHAHKLGADHMINYKRTTDWGAEVRKLTDGRGADHVLDVGGKDTFAQSLQAVRSGRHVSVIGLLTGMPETSPGLGANTVAIGVGSRFDFDEMCRAIEGNELRPVIDKTFALEDITEALAYLKDGKHFGKVAIHISD